MSITLQSDPPPLRKCADGVIRVADTRIPLERVIRAFLVGATAEQIAQDYESLSLKEVYAVINFYLHNRDDVTKYLVESEREAATIRSELEQSFDPAGIRARLLGRGD